MRAIGKNRIDFYIATANAVQSGHNRVSVVRGWWTRLRIVKQRGSPSASAKVSHPRSVGTESERFFHRAGRKQPARNLGGRSRPLTYMISALPYPKLGVII